MPDDHLQVPYRKLGTTGEKVSLLGLGGYHIGVPEDEAEGIGIVRMALDHGVNFLDNSWDYHQGRSEILVGKALRGGYREKAFVMTKIDGRTRESAADQLNESLARLDVEHIDLVQIHEVMYRDDPERVFAPDGAIHALIDAKAAGVVRYIGFTGHKDPDVFLRMLQWGFDHDFVFDTVQMPLNVLDHHYRSFEQRVMPVLLDNGIAVLGMKPLCDGRILETGVVTAEECWHYAMSLPTSVVITGLESMERLQVAIEAARRYRPLTDQEREELLARMAPLAADGRYETYKTTEAHDGTRREPAWLG